MLIHSLEIFSTCISFSAPEGSDSDNEEQEGAVSNPLLADLNTSEEHLSKQAKLWFKRVCLF